MDRNSFTGLFLILVIMVDSYFLLQPSKEQVKQEQAKVHADSVRKGLIKTPGEIAAAKKADTAKTTATIAPAVDTSKLKGFEGATVGAETFVTLENNDVRIKLSTHGGGVSSVELKNYKTFYKKPLILFDGPQNHFNLGFVADNKNYNTNNLYFKPSAPQLTVAGKDSGSVTMRLSYSATQYIDYVYTLNGTGFKLGFTVKPTGLESVMPNTKTLNIDWETNPLNQEKDIDQERRYSSVYYKTTDGTVDDLSTTKDDSLTIAADKKTQWVSFKAHFFSNSLLSPNGFTKASIGETLDTANHGVV